MEGALGYKWCHGHDVTGRPGAMATERRAVNVALLAGYCGPDAAPLEQARAHAGPPSLLHLCRSPSTVVDCSIEHFLVS